MEVVADGVMGGVSAVPSSKVDGVGSPPPPSTSTFKCDPYRRTAQSGTAVSTCRVDWLLVFSRVGDFCPRVMVQRFFSLLKLYVDQIGFLFH